MRFNGKLLGVAVVAALASACGTSYKCPLAENGGPSCSSKNMQTIYSAATKAEPNYAGEYVTDSQGYKNSLIKAHAAAGQAVAPADAQSMGLPANERGMPVYEQPKVQRAWVAPWVDAEGNLHSGTYVYTTTPGKWNYGTLKAAGDVGAMMEPVKPEDYGFKFKPTTKSTVTKKPVNEVAPQQATPTSSNQESLKAAQKTVQQVNTNGGVNTVNNITQPYVRLAE